MKYEMKKTDTTALDDAYWIGTPAKFENEQNTRLQVETAYFMRSFFLSEKADCTIKTSAHSRYKLYVNGRFVTYGPCKGDDYRRYCDTVDIGEFLVAGKNIILLHVVGYPPYEAGDQVQKGPDWSMNRACGACLMLAGNLLTAKEKVRLTTGQSDWRIYSSKELTPRYDEQSSAWLGYMEQLDLKHHVQAEKPEDSGTDRKWELPVRLWSVEDSAFGILPVFELYERPISFPYLEKKFFSRQMPVLQGTEGFPSLNDGNCLTIPPDTNAVLELDAGSLTTGFFKMPVDSGAGAKVKVLYSEAYGIKNPPSERYLKTLRDDWENGELEGHFDLFSPSGEKNIFEPFWFRTFRYIRIEIKTGKSPLTLSTPFFLETGYPVEQRTKPLPGNTSWVNDLWDISLRTLRRCMHETYEDCPFYEQMQYTLDTRLQMLFTYAVDGDRSMPLRTMYDYHASQLPNGMLQSRYPCEVKQVIPPFALHWIDMVNDFYWESGDAEIIERYRPTMEAVLSYFRSHKKNGLAERLGYWEFVDWSPEWSDTHGVPHACQRGPSTIINFNYAYTLRITADMMRVIGLSDLANYYESEADEISLVLYEQCFNKEKGLYRDGPDFDEYSQHAQVWAVLAEAGDFDFRKKLMQRVSEADFLIPCTFPLQFYLFRAYEAVGLYEYTENLWDLWRSLLPLHVTTVPEIPEKARSDCHAWGSILLYEFTRKMMGVEAETPGYEVISIRPRAMYLSFASGVVHTPKGDIRIHYSIEDKTFRINISHDCDAEVFAYLPNGEKTKCPQGKTVDLDCRGGM